MAVEYTLKIQQIDCIPELDGKADVVSRVHWAYTAKDGDRTASCGGAVNIPLEDGDFTPYSNLTEQQVIQWVLDSLPLDRIQQSLFDQIQVQSKPLPWSNDNG